MPVIRHNGAKGTTTQRRWTDESARAPGQSVARHPINGVAVGGRDMVRHLRRSI